MQGLRGWRPGPVPGLGGGGGHSERGPERGAAGGAEAPSVPEPRQAGH